MRIYVLLSFMLAYRLHSHMVAYKLHSHIYTLYAKGDKHSGSLMLVLVGNHWYKTNQLVSKY